MTPRRAETLDTEHRKCNFSASETYTAYQGSIILSLYTKDHIDHKIHLLSVLHRITTEVILNTISEGTFKCLAGLNK